MKPEVTRKKQKLQDEARRKYKKKFKFMFTWRKMRIFLSWGHQHETRDSMFLCVWNAIGVRFGDQFRIWNTYTSHEKLPDQIITRRHLITTTKFSSFLIEINDFKINRISLFTPPIYRPQVKISAYNCLTRISCLRAIRILIFIWAHLSFCFLPWF